MWKILKSLKQPDLLEKCSLKAVAESLNSPLCWAPQLMAHMAHTHSVVCPAQLEDAGLQCQLLAQQAGTGLAGQPGGSLQPGLIPGFLHAPKRPAFLLGWIMYSSPFFPEDEE